MAHTKTEIIWHVFSRKDSPLWWAWKFNPKPPPDRIRASTGKKKNEYTREEMVRILNPGGKLQYPHLSLAWFEDYNFEKLKLEGVSKGTINVYKTAFRYFIQIFGPEYSIQNIDRDAVDKYKSHLLSLGKSPVTINDYLRHLRAAFERLLLSGKIEKNPFYRFKPLKEERNRKAFTLLELREFLDFVRKNSTEEMYHLFRIYAGTGRRRNEILYLRREDVDLKKKIYYPMNIKSRVKTRLVRSIPDNLIDDFRYFLKSDRENPFLFWHEHTITHQAAKLLKQAGFQGYSIHSFRHTYLTLLNEMNYSVRQAQRIIDHRNIQTTTEYFHDDVLESPEIGI